MMMAKSVRQTVNQLSLTKNVNVKQGYTEESNVNVIDELVASMSYQRSYEMNLKLIKLASELDQGTASLLRLPNN